MTEEATIEGQESLCKDVSLISLNPSTTRSLLDLPTDILNELCNYLPAKNIKTLTQTCTQLKAIYDKFRWDSCIVYPDAKDTIMMSRYMDINMEIEIFDRYKVRDDSFPAYDEIPARVFYDPSSYSWFRNDKTRNVLISGKPSQNDLLFSNIFKSEFNPEDYPRIKNFLILPQLSIADDDMLEYEFFLSLGGGVMHQLESQGFEMEPFWKLSLNGSFFNGDGSVLDFDSFRFSLQELSLHSNVPVDEIVIEAVELPNLKKLFLGDLEYDLYSMLLRRLHHWPKLEHLTFTLVFSPPDQYSQTTVSPIVPGIQSLPDRLKTCDLILAVNKYPEDELDPINGVIRLEKVTSILDYNYYQSYKNTDDYSIIDYLDLPQVQKAVQVFVVRSENKNPFIARDLGKTLTYLDLAIWFAPLEILSHLSKLVNLRVLVLGISCYQNTFSKHMKTILKTISRRLAKGEQWSEDELKSTFMTFLKENGDDLFKKSYNYEDEEEDENEDELTFDKMLSGFMLLVTDPMKLARNPGEFGKNLEVILLLEAFLANLSTILPALEYLFLEMQYVYPSPQFQRLVLEPPPSLRQLLLSYDGDFEPPVIPQIKSKFEIKDTFTNQVVYDLAQRRSFPLMNQGKIFPMACDNDDFNGWV